MDYNLTFLTIMISLCITYFYYTKYKEYEKEFYILNKKHDKAIVENDNYKLRIKDLQKYKNDVSKTFKILDNELNHINNHVERQNQLQLQLHRQNNDSSFNNVNLLTTDILTNLINNMNQEYSTPQNTPSVPLEDTVQENETIRENSSTELDSGSGSGSGSGSESDTSINEQNNVLSSPEQSTTLHNMGNLLTASKSSYQYFKI